MVQVIKYDNSRGGCWYKIVVNGKVICKGLMYYQINAWLALYGYADQCNAMYDDCKAMVQYPIEGE